MERFAKAAAWSFVGAVCSRLVTLAANVLVARRLGPDGFGRLGMVVSTATLLTTAASLGLGIAVSRFVAQQRAEDRSRVAGTLRAGLAMALIAGLALAALTAAFPWVLADRALGAPGLAGPLRICSPWIVFAALAGLQTGALAGLEDFRGLAIVTAVRGLASAALLWGGAAMAGIEGAVAGQASAELIGLLWGRAAVRHAMDRQGVPEAAGGWRDEIGPLLSFSLPGFLASAAIAPAFWLGRVWLVRSPDGFAQAGLFEASNKWALAILFIPSAVGAVQVPLLSNFLGAGHHSGYRHVLGLNLLVVAASCVVPGTLVALFAERLLVLNGPSFAAGAGTLTVLALSTVFIALNSTLGAGLISRGRVWRRSLADWILAALILAASWALIPRLGAIGFALAHAIAYGLVSIGLGIDEGIQLRKVPA